jgi:subtilisin family serine protease
VLLREDSTSAATKALEDIAGMRVVNSRDFSDGAVTLERADDADALILDELGIAVVDPSAAPERTRALSMAAASGDAVLAVEPERVVYAIQDGATGEYVRGYRDGVADLASRVLPQPVDRGLAQAQATWDESQLTWGLQATKAAASSHSGKGIRVAVLDTGMDLAHPDFAGRAIQSHSFVLGEAVQDGHGHGTHCIGTACGPRAPGVLPRYGVAHEADIYAGKVLSNRGSGGDAGILAGITWAILNGCAVVSMSLGAPTVPGQRPSLVFEFAAQRALRRGTLIVAAAGNESSRPHSIQPVGHPANCPSILAVAALTPDLGVAGFSCGGINTGGGEVNIAAPGVAVHSSWPMPLRHRKLNGTSMATPHVAGIAALYAQANPTIRGMDLWNLVLSHASALPLPARDVGRGLVIAP